MRCRLLSGNPRFATTPPPPHFAEHCRKLNHFSSSVSSCSSYRLHSAWRRGGHLRLRRKEHIGWRTSVTGGETQQLLQTDVAPARHRFETRGELNNCQHELEYRICSTPLAQSHAYTKYPSAPHSPRLFSSDTEFRSVHGRCSVGEPAPNTKFFGLLSARSQTSHSGRSGLRTKRGVEFYCRHASFLSLTIWVVCFRESGP